jgi:hypothetical protein
VNPKICLVVGCTASFLSGCGGDSSTVTVEPHPTIVELSPRDFLGSLTCGSAEGNLQRYVATLTDVTRVDAEGENESGAGGGPGEPLDFALPSSLPIRCEQGVAFGLVVSGHFYTAKIDGYDRSDLEPMAEGAPILIDPSTKKPVAPRWTTSCGTPCPYVNEDGSRPGKACPAEPLPPNPTDTEYSFAVRAEYQLTRKLEPCWAWSSASNR